MDLSKIGIVWLFIISTIGCVLNTNLRAYYVKRNLKTNSELFLLISGTCIVTAIFVFILSGFSVACSLYSVLLGAVFGIVTAMQTISLCYAIEKGPYSYTTIISNMSTVITAFSGWILFHEAPPTTLQIIGIVLMAGCFFLSIDTSNDKNKKSSITWFLLSFLALISGAGVGLLQKTFMTYENADNELNMFLTVSFIVGGIIAYITSSVFKSKENKTTSIEHTSNLKKTIKFLAITIIVCGIGTALCNVINLYLSGKVNSAIFFPIVNGIPLIISLVVSFVIFKEKLTLKQTIGIVIGVISIACLCVKI